MRILAGDLKYKRIKYIKDKNLRPTRSIVRKSFFDTVRPLIEGCVFLDLFAGVGSVGLEAASRGAKKVIFVDKSFRSIGVIKSNVGESGCGNKSVIVRSDAYDFIDSADLGDIDIAYIDAPYNFNINRLLHKFFTNINRNALVCVEHASTTLAESQFDMFINFKNRSFGKNILDYFGVVDE